MQSWRAIIAGMLLLTTSLADTQAGRKAPSVSVAPIPLSEIAQGKSGTIDIHFRVASGFHINSNTPKSEYLIPTALKLDAPTDIMIGRVSYPDGSDMSFPFAPEEKLNVYSGDFSVGLLVRPLHSVTPGKYVVHGVLKYQACDNAACYPPKRLPVEFEVKVVKAPPQPSHRPNPAQSPHVHG